MLDGSVGSYVVEGSADSWETEVVLMEDYVLNE
jgi:hypothetical protein